MSGLKDIESWLRKKRLFIIKKSGPQPQTGNPQKTHGEVGANDSHKDIVAKECRSCRWAYHWGVIWRGLFHDLGAPTMYANQQPQKKGAPKKIPNSPKLTAALISWDVLKGLNLNVVMLPLIRNPDNLIQNSYKKGWCPSSTTGKQWKKPHYMSWYCLVNRDPGEILIMNYHGSNWVVQKKQTKQNTKQLQGEVGNGVFVPPLISGL